jgi:hypothetical protein
VATETLTGHWKFDKEFDPADWAGFVYLIQELHSGRGYIGKKSFHALTRKRIAGRKNRRHIHKESNWRTYTGSSTALNAAIEQYGIENYEFHILSLHTSKASLSYSEIEQQVKRDVLRARLPDGTFKYYNKCIGAVRYPPPHTTELELQFRCGAMTFC